MKQGQRRAPDSEQAQQAFRCAEHGIQAFRVFDLPRARRWFERALRLALYCPDEEVAAMRPYWEGRLQTIIDLQRNLAETDSVIQRRAPHQV